jgi:ankyrin repeat protein
MDQVVWLTTMKSGNLDEVKALIDAARETNERLVFMGGSTPLHWAAESGSIGCVKLLLDSKLCQLDEKDASGATPLHWASGEGHVEIVQLLHKNGCELDVLDANNETPLHYA